MSGSLGTFAGFQPTVTREGPIYTVSIDEAESGAEVRTVYGTSPRYRYRMEIILQGATEVGTMDTLIRNNYGEGGNFTITDPVVGRDGDRPHGGQPIPHGARGYLHVVAGPDVLPVGGAPAIMIDSPAATLLASGASSFVIVDTYVIGAYTFSSDTAVIKRGTLVSALGLDPATLDVTIATGGSGGPGAAFKAAALAGSLAGLPFTYARTYVGTGGGDVLRFTGTVQRVEPSSTDVRIVAISQTVDLDSVLLPTDVIMSDAYPEIPPPENYNVR